MQNHQLEKRPSVGDKDGRDAKHTADEYLEEMINLATSNECSGLLWACPKCGHHQVSKHTKKVIEANWAEGSQKKPLRCVCRNPECNERIRLRSEDRDCVLAEVPWRKIGQRNAAKVVAEGANIQGEGERLKMSEYYRLWHDSIGYTGKKRIPQPFRRWQKRGGA